MDLRAASAFWPEFSVIPKLASVLISSLLILSAALKSYQSLHDLLYFEPASSATAFELFSVSILVFVATLVLTNFRSREVWILAALLMTILAAFALSAALAGETTCGCFGKLSFRPWSIVILDVSIIVVSYLCAIVSRPHSGSLLRPVARAAGELLLMVTLMVLAMALALSISWPHAISAQALTSSHHPIPATPIEPSVEWVEALIPVRNVRRTSVAIVGKESVCGIILVTPIPLVIPAQETIFLEMKLRLFPHAQRGDGSLALFIADESHSGAELVNSSSLIKLNSVKSPGPIQSPLAEARPATETVNSTTLHQQRLRQERLVFSVVRASPPQETMAEKSNETSAEKLTGDPVR